jgi:hypothetical protein
MRVLEREKEREREREMRAGECVDAAEGTRGKATERKSSTGILGRAASV